MHKIRGPFLLSNGDELKDFDLRKLIRFHNLHPQRPLATLALTRVVNPQGYGVPRMHRGVITEFIEKPARPFSRFVSAGTYILDPEIFRYVDWSKTPLMIEKDIFPKLARERKLAGFKLKEGQWFDCGTFERWGKAMVDWDPPFHFRK